MRSKLDKNPLLLVSAPKHTLFQAKALVERHGGYCAAFPPDDPRSSTRKGVLCVLRQLLRLFVTANWTEACNLLGESVMSWTSKHQWKLVWKGGVSQALGMLKHDNPEKNVHAIAIKGGRQCDWEQKQMAPGGEVWKMYPQTQLTVFQDVDELEKTLSAGSSKTK